MIVLLPQVWPQFKADDASMAAYLATWGFFTLCLFVATLRLSKALQFVLGTLVLLFFLLAIGHAQHMDPKSGFSIFTGYEGILCGVSACYTGIAQVLNELHGRTVLPLGAPAKK